MHLSKTGTTLFLALLLSALSLASTQSVPQLTQRTIAATVFLKMQDENGNALGQGSGFFVRRNLIATNLHVIDGAVTGSAKLVNRETVYPIEGVTATDETNDLVLLKVTIHGVTPLPLCDSDAVQIGETVYVVGNPLGFEGTFSDGIISGRRDSAAKKERLQMTAPISPGSNGGPVLNRMGKVIGVSTSVYNPLFGQNLNFLVPSNALKALLNRSGEANPLSYSNETVSYFTYLRRGYEKNLSGDYEGAIQEFTHAIHLDPTDAKTYRNRGLAKSKLIHHFAAILDYDVAIRLKPNNAIAYNNRGLAKNELGQHFAAIADYDAAIRLDPDDGVAYYNRAITKHELGECSDAVADYDAAIRLKPNNVFAYNNRGLAKDDLGQHFAAIADFSEAIRLNPDDTDAYVNRGVAKRKLSQYSAAIADYDAAIRLDPNNAFAYNNRGTARDYLGQHFAAIVDFSEAIRLNPDDTFAYVNRGLTKRKLGRYVSAIRDFKSALRLATFAGDQSLKTRIEKELRQLQQQAHRQE